jgi:hypothetical protein
VLIDGASSFPALEQAIRCARRSVLIAGWCITPGFALVRDEPRVLLRELLGEAAEAVDVRVLLWAGAPVPVFTPRRASVRAGRDELVRGTRIKVALDSNERPMHCHHEKLVVIDKGVSKRFLDDSKTREMSRRVKRGFTAIGVFGHLARMVVFGLIGYGLVKAAVDYNPRSAIGLDGALNKLLHNSYGTVPAGRRRRRVDRLRGVLDRRRPLREDLTRARTLPHRRENPPGSSGGVLNNDRCPRRLD